MDSIQILAVLISCGLLLVVLDLVRYPDYENIHRGFRDFNRTSFDLRDKKILKFDRDKADSLVLTKGAESIEMARSGSDWKIVKPVPSRSDYSGIEAFLTRHQRWPVQVGLSVAALGLAGLSLGVYAGSAGAAGITTLADAIAVDWPTLFL